MPELACYRAAAYRTPIRARRHRDDAGGRFHDPGSPPTQYLCLHPLGPWAELVRNQRCATLAEALEVRVPVWAVRLVLEDEPFRLDFDAAASAEAPHPISADGLVADDPSECRALARAWRRDTRAPPVVRVPSAALPGTDNIVIFAARRGIEYLAHPRRPTQVPYASAAVDGQMAAGLFEHIRLAGQPHAGLEAWRRGEEIALPEIRLR